MAFDEQVREITTFDFFDAEEVLTRLGMTFDEDQHLVNSILSPIKEQFVNLGYEDKQVIFLLGGVSLAMTFMVLKFTILLILMPINKWVIKEPEKNERWT